MECVYTAIVPQSGDEIEKAIEVLYKGCDYSKGFDAAVQARSEKRFKGKWIYFKATGRPRWAFVA